MLSSNVKALISEVVELYSTTPLTQSLIDDGVNKLIKAKELLTNGKGDETQEKEYKHWIFNPLDTSYLIENAFINSTNGVQCAINKYKCTDFLEIPDGTKEIILTLTLNGNFSTHIGAFYDNNKNFVDGISSLEGRTKYYFKNGENYLSCSIDENIKYIRLSSGSSGDIQGAYCLTNKKPSEKIFEHYSNNNYTVNTVADMKKMNLNIGDTVTTLGYNCVGDLGEATYTIMNYDEWHYLLPDDVKYILSNNSYSKTPVDEFGNHTISNGLIAKLNIDQEIKPEQWGAKAEKTFNSCPAFVHMFAQVKTGKIVLKENGIYNLGLIKETDTISSFTDNPYKNFMCGGLLGGQNYSKPIMANIENIEIAGDNTTITIPNNTFGNSGMGILNFAGKVDGLKIHGINFDGNARTIMYPNKNSNHTIFYAPATYTSNNVAIKDMHPLYDKLSDSFKGGYINNFEVCDCNFFDSGARYRQAGDFGGDFILIINPNASDNVNIHHNTFKAWGRWVLAVDLGGNGECLTNYKFEDNICIGNNAKDENDVYIIPTPEGGISNNGEETWRWRALGLIDFEAKKCFDNVSIQRNYIRGAAGWAINGASRITQNVIIKDNYWYHCTGGYPYTIEFYSGEAKNWIIDNNDFVVKPNIKLGISTNNVQITNNKNIAVRFLGLQGNIDIENNETDYGFNIDSMNAPTYLTEEERNVNLIFKNNRASINGNLNFPFMHYDFSGNTINGINLIDFTTHSDLGLSNQIVNTVPNYLQHFHAFGFRFTTPMEKPSIGSYWKSGDIIHESTKNFGLVNSYFYKNLIDGFSKYNWNFTNYIKQKGLKDIKMLCTEDGIVPGVGAWGFNNQFTGWNDAAGKKFQDKSYVYTEDNLYYIEKAGTLDINNKPTHTDGISICGECELKWIDKIAKVELIEIV